MKILLTGANGFIGSHLVARLIDQNHTLIVLKRKKSDLSRIKEFVSDTQFFDYERADVLADIFKNKIDVVIHLAGVYIKNDSTCEDIHRINQFNIDTASQLAYMANKNGVNGFINTGTFFEYNLSGQELLHENSRIDPLNYYASSKVAFEQILKYVCKSGNMKGITLKLFSPYGEMDNEKVIPLIIKSAISKRELRLNDSTQTLSFTHIDDIVDAYIKAILYIKKMDSPYDSFNISSNEVYSIGDIVEHVQKITSDSVPVYFSHENSNQKSTIVVRCDTAKAKKMLGWQPKTDILTGLKKTYEYYKKSI